MGLREWRNSLIYPNPLQVLKERRSRLTHFSMRRSGSLVTTIYRLGRQCSGPSGACASLATCDSRARTNSPASLDRPATRGQIGVFQRSRESFRYVTSKLETNWLI